MITEIAIRNFRSIDSQDVSANWITSFVGANDAGKSNVLRALNLFFNGETEAGQPFSFARDYNQFAEVRRQKAQQVEIRVRFRLPESYQREGYPDEVEWRKFWRESGQITRMESRAYVGGAEFPPRSKIPVLLDRIRSTYIPAIKDTAFFTDLQGRLYDVLSTVAEQPLKASAAAFEEQLQDQLRDLLSSISTVFSAESAMRLPENLRRIFESLEISSGRIPLSRRGDGIKIRHIPMILGFIADKHDELLTRGGIRYTHIWGFEEPENNVEMSAAFKMASDLTERIFSQSHSQLFLTTHSPIFYRLDQQHEEGAEWVTTHFVEKRGSRTIVDAKAPDEVDESMGLMPIVAPYVAEAKKKFDDVQERLRRAVQVADQRVPTLFVEGTTDKDVAQLGMGLFHQGLNLNVDDGGTAYGSANALASRSVAWLLEMRHRAQAERVRAVALFDSDPAGSAAKRGLTDMLQKLGLQNHPHFRIFSLRTPPRLHALAQGGFNIAIDLESLYSDDLWNHAQQRGWLEPVERVSSVFSEAMLEQLADGGENPLINLDAADQLRIRHRFTDAGKRNAARYLGRLDGARAREAIGGLRPTLDQVAGFFQGA